MEAKHTAMLYGTPSGQIFAPGQIEAVATVHQLGANMPAREEMLATMENMVRAYNAHGDLVHELTAAEKIILAMLNAMTPEQKAQVHAKLDAEGVSGEGMTRYHERRAALTKAQGA